MTPPAATKMASLHTNEASWWLRAPRAEAMAKVRCRSNSPSASTSPEAAAARMNAKASSSLVSPDRSRAVSPDRVILSWVSMSWTIAPEAGPRSRRTEDATAGGGPLARTSRSWYAADPVACATYDAFATKNESLGAVGNSRTTPA